MIALACFSKHSRDALPLFLSCREGSFLLVWARDYGWRGQCMFKQHLGKALNSSFFYRFQGKKMLQAAHSIPTQKRATSREREKGIRLDLIKKEGEKSVNAGYNGMLKRKERKGGVGRRHTFRLHIYFSNAQLDLFKFHNVANLGNRPSKLFASLATWHISCAVSKNLSCMKPSQ